MERERWWTCLPGAILLLQRVSRSGVSVLVPLPMPAMLMPHGTACNWLAVTITTTRVGNGIRFAFSHYETQLFIIAEHTTKDEAER